MPRTKESPTINSERLMLAYLCIKELEGLPARIGLLDRFDLTDAEIARVCGVANQSVRNARLAAKKQKVKRKKEPVVQQASN